MKRIMLLLCLVAVAKDAVQIVQQASRRRIGCVPICCNEGKSQL